MQQDSEEIDFPSSIRTTYYDLVDVSLFEDLNDLARDGLTENEPQQAGIQVSRNAALPMASRPVSSAPRSASRSLGSESRPAGEQAGSMALPEPGASRQPSLSPASGTPLSRPPSTASHMALNTRWDQYNASIQGSNGALSAAGRVESLNIDSMQNLFKRVRFLFIRYDPSDISLTLNPTRTRIQRAGNG